MTVLRTVVRAPGGNYALVEWIAGWGLVGGSFSHVIRTPRGFTLLMETSEPRPPSRATDSFSYKPQSNKPSVVCVHTHIFVHMNCVSFIYVNTYISRSFISVKLYAIFMFLWRKESIYLQDALLGSKGDSSRF